MLQLDLSKLSTFLPEDYIDSRAQALATAHTWLQEGSGRGGDFTGWVKLPANYDRDEFARIKAAARTIRYSYSSSSFMPRFTSRIVP